MSLNPKPPGLKYSGNCSNCNTGFAIWKAKFRYFCSACGDCFCKECVPNYCALPQIGLRKKARICDSCFSKHCKCESDFETEIDNEMDEDDWDEEVDEDEEENARYIPNEITSQKIDDDTQLKIALSLSDIDNKVYNYVNGDHTNILSEEEEIEVVCRISEMEEQAKQFALKLPINSQLTSNQMSEDEQLELALAISKLEVEDDVKPVKIQQKDRQLNCPICLEERLEYAFNCGHVVCGDCRPKLEECPICRTKIREALRLYLTE